MKTTDYVLIIGVFSGAFLCALLAWSIVFPQKRLWPPERITFLNQSVVWGATIAVFCSSFVLGVMGWNDFNWPATLRWPLGGLLLVGGNLVVWRGVFYIGPKATSGGTDKLKTKGLYKYSRNPQYMADIAILAGAFFLSASSISLPVIALGIIALLIAPLAEEPWLQKTYGAEYEEYKKTTRRYL